MISRISILLIICISGFLLTPLQSTAFSNQSDSLKVKTINGKKFIQHKVAPNETWSHLARKYNCSVSDMMAANNGVEIIKIDQILNIPINTQTATVAPAKTKSEVVKAAELPKSGTPQSTKLAGKTPVIHTVRSGETLFAIARKYSQTVETIKEYNNLKADGIKPDQKLIVKYVSNTANQVIAQTEVQKVIVPPSAPKTGVASADLNSTPVIEKAEADKKANKTTELTEEALAAKNEMFFDKPTKSVTTVKKGSSNKSMVQVTETGVATWILDGSPARSKFFGLHRSAPIGTIVKVTNRMNNLSVYVKIVGVLPDTGDNDNVIIKMSQAVSEKLNALDMFFQVELSYGMME